MKRIALPLLIAIAMSFSVGCTTKKYVRRQVTPVMNKVDELDERTAQTTRGIHELDDRTQKGIQGVEAKADAADQKAQAASEQADQAQQLADTTNAGVDKLTDQVINFDNYHAVSEAAIHFGFDKHDLTAESREELDALGGQISGVPNYIVQIEGRTDSVGSREYNYQLSQRRAAAVTQYLATRFGVPAYKIFVIGLGKDAPVDTNATRTGRAENRRVDVRLMTNVVDPPAAASADSTVEAPMDQPMPAAVASPQQ
jgi:OOP family OmpA-OmpF porin